jgi:hypothetical protein
MTDLNAAEAPSGFCCTIYPTRPSSCRTYPWSDAQVLFPQCVFVRDGEIISAAQAAETLGSPAEVERACRDCGRCCFGWLRTSSGLEPVARCRHVVFNDTANEDVLDTEQKQMLAVKARFVPDEFQSRGVAP